MNITELEKLNNIVREAETLCTQYDHVHNMHGALGGLKIWILNYEEGYRVNWKNVYILITAMRKCQYTGICDTNLIKVPENLDWKTI